MRPDAVLINACRGPVVVEKDVAEALDAGKLFGYAADVFAVEPPLPGHPLIGRPDVLLTPHSAAQTVEGLTNMAEWVARDVLAVLHGKAPGKPGQRSERCGRQSETPRVAAPLSRMNPARSGHPAGLCDLGPRPYNGRARRSGKRDEIGYLVSIPPWSQSPCRQA